MSTNPKRRIRFMIPASLQAKILLSALGRLGIHETHDVPIEVICTPGAFGMFMADLAQMEKPPTLAHLKIEHIDANVVVKAGQHMKISDTKIAYPSASEISDGVVDPFATKPIKPGKLIRLFFKPESNAFFLE